MARKRNKQKDSSRASDLGGVVHTYQKYDPKKFPSPTQPPPDLVSPMMEHMLQYGTVRQLTEEELARAVKLDPAQFAKLGPSIDKIKAMLEEKRRQILEKYETDTVTELAGDTFREAANELTPPKQLLSLIHI